MSDQYVGEIRMFAGNYAPQGWELCDGRALSVSDYQILYALIGTTYGGNQVSFNLPDLRGRLPIGRSTNRPQGTAGGVETVVLTPAQLPSHTHVANANKDLASSAGTVPTNAFWGNSGTMAHYQEFAAASLVPMSDAAVSSVGGGVAHENVMPSFVVNFIIAVQGIFPSQG